MAGISLRAALRPFLVSLIVLALGLSLLLTAARAATPASPAAAPAAPAAPQQHSTDSAPATTGSTTPVAGRQYTFSSVVASKPVRWNPCVTMYWKANVSRGPAGGLDVLKAAVAKVAVLTGTRWVYAGTTTAIPSSRLLPTRYSTTNTPVVIGWTDGTASDLLRNQPTGVTGMARTTWFSMQDNTGRTITETKAGVIALDRTDRLPLRGASSWSAVALHELSHVMGLGHAPDSRQLMAATLPRTTSDLQTGDRTGLNLVGKSQGCITFPTVG